jgi:LysM repeat protein
MAANPGMKIPSGKVFVPVPAGNNVVATSYSRPTNLPASAAVPTNLKVVKAKAGDTVKKVADREKIPNSVLGAGRELKIPGK